MNGGEIALIIFVVILILVGLGIGIYFLVKHDQKKQPAPDGGTSGGGTTPSNGGTTPSGSTGAFSFRNVDLPQPYAYQFNFNQNASYWAPGTPGDLGNGSYLISSANCIGSGTCLGTPGIGIGTLPNAPGTNVIFPCNSGGFTIGNYTRSDGTIISNAWFWTGDPTNKKILCAISNGGLGANKKYVIVDNADNPETKLQNGDTMQKIDSKYCSWVYNTSTKNICLSSDPSSCMLSDLNIAIRRVSAISIEGSARLIFWGTPGGQYTGSTWDIITPPVAPPACCITGCGDGSGYDPPQSS